ncbi:VOC family protein [Buttiauxella sp. B2]|uniref:VOC family protein n=1 Tax=Buttiauxella sp. B2 TaxID=2587812 RepID=UPI001123A6A5|nr:VOC family protein [Buttiauxella sp. B2]TNV20765.1 VOC family protein [Buttiauxella sp. B2]
MNTIINWFEIPVQDLERATAFYEAVFTTKFHRETMSGMEMVIFPHEKPHPGGALLKADTFKPSTQGSVVYLHAPDLNTMLERVVKAGGECVFGPQELPDDIGTFALIVDSEGNRVGLHQPA